MYDSGRSEKVSSSELPPGQPIPTVKRELGRETQSRRPGLHSVLGGEVAAEIRPDSTHWLGSVIVRWGQF